jgi:AraC-like DNA-binding protein
MKKFILENIIEDDFLFYIFKANKIKKVARHNHDFFEIVYVYEGSGILEIDDKKYKFKANQINFTPPNISHKYTSRPNTYHKQISIPIHKDIFNNIKSTFNYLELIDKIKKENLYLIDVPPENIKDIEENIENIYQEYGFKSKNYKKLILLKLQTLLIYIDRFISENRGILKKFKNLDPIIYKVLKNIETNYDQITDTDSILNNIKIDKKYFIRLFKKNTGYTPINYLNRVKIEKCCELLLATENTITQIAYNCGFNDTGYFNRQFKKFLSLTPKKFRKLSSQKRIKKNKFNRFSFPI